MTMDEKKWTGSLAYHEQDPALALEILRLLRSKTHQLFQKLDDAVFNTTFYHPEGGETTLWALLQGGNAHIRGHAAQIARTYAAWQNDSH